jgi:5-methylcytosine-specific restriction endonuclease McrA
LKNGAQLREQVLARCEGYCEKCGRGLPEGFALHHRKLKSRGGKDAIENLIALHHECHNTGTNSVHLNVKLATENGYIVPQHADPAEYVMLLPNGSTVKLTLEGTYDYIERKEDYGW